MNDSILTEDQRLLELLEKWNCGDFTRSDEQEMQALAATDDFRKESVEGYMHVPGADHEQALIRLRGRVQAQKSRTSAHILPKLSALAAALALLVAAVWFFGPNQNKSERNSAAAPKTLDTTQTILSGRVEEQSDSNADKIQADIVYSTPGTKRKEIDEPEATKIETKEDVAFQTVPDAIKLDQISYEEAKSNKDALPGSSDAGPSALSTPKPAVSKNSSVPSTKPADDEDYSLDTSHGNANPAPKRAAKTQAELPAVEDNFRAYLYQNARLTDAARNNNVSGYVRVRFNIDKDGKPKKLKVLQSLGFGCDEIAKTLINSYQFPADFAPKSNLEFDVPFVK
jgi:outer membrane biosynthesis protein TonB